MRRAVLTLFSLALLFVAVFAASPRPAYAAGAFDAVCASQAEGQPVPTTCTDTTPDPENPDSNPITGADGILMRATKLVALVTGVASVIMVIVGAIKYIVSAGDSSSVNSAKNTIFYALIGLVVSVAAQGIVLFVTKYI